MRATRRNNDGKATFTTTQLIEGKRENSVGKGFATSRRKNDKDIIPLYDSIELGFHEGLSNLVTMPSKSILYQSGRNSKSGIQIIYASLTFQHSDWTRQHSGAQNNFLRPIGQT